MANSSHPISEYIAPITDPDELAIVTAAIVKIVNLWELSSAEAASLFGISQAIWVELARGNTVGSLDSDPATRVSLILGIFRILGTIFNGDLASAWPKTPNNGPLYGGRSPIALMIAGGVPAMVSVRSHLECL
jgi:hypothetical protein